LRKRLGQAATSNLPLSPRGRSGWERHDEPAGKSPFPVEKRPHGTPQRDDFSLETGPVPTAPEGGLVVRNRFISLDPAQRGWMDDAPSYMPPIPLGEPVRATTVGVVHGRAIPISRPATGCWASTVWKTIRWSPRRLYQQDRRVDRGPPLTLSFGRGRGRPHRLFRPDRCRRAARGETLLVTGAAGAVGSMVGQIGKILGLRVIGIAGGAEKCRRLVEDYGFDVAIDYKGKAVDALAAEVAAAAPDGVDILFENVAAM
jgi:NADPH-dependent curcumin reductase CurA